MPNVISAPAVPQNPNTQAMVAGNSQIAALLQNLMASSQAAVASGGGGQRPRAEGPSWAGAVGQAGRSIQDIQARKADEDYRQKSLGLQRDQFSEIQKQNTIQNERAREEYKAKQLADLQSHEWNRALVRLKIADEHRKEALSRSEMSQAALAKFQSETGLTPDKLIQTATYQQAMADLAAAKSATSDQREIEDTIRSFAFDTGLPREIVRKSLGLEPEPSTTAAVRSKPGAPDVGPEEMAGAGGQGGTTQPVRPSEQYSMVRAGTAVLSQVQQLWDVFSRAERIDASKTTDSGIPLELRVAGEAATKSVKEQGVVQRVLKSAMETQKVTRQMYTTVTTRVDALKAGTPKAVERSMARIAVGSRVDTTGVLAFRGRSMFDSLLYDLGIKEDYDDLMSGKNLNDPSKMLRATVVGELLRDAATQIDAWSPESRIGADGKPGAIPSPYAGGSPNVEALKSAIRELPEGTRPYLKDQHSWITKGFYKGVTADVFYQSGEFEEVRGNLAAHLRRQADRIAQSNAGQAGRNLKEVATSKLVDDVLTKVAEGVSPTTAMIQSMKSYVQGNPAAEVQRSVNTDALIAAVWAMKGRLPQGGAPVAQSPQTPSEVVEPIVPSVPSGRRPPTPTGRDQLPSPFDNEVPLVEQSEVSDDFLRVLGEGGY